MRTTRTLTAAAALVAALLLLTACTTGTPAERGAGPAPGSASGSATPSPAPTEPPDAKLIATAKVQAAQYDYDGAIATLSAGTTDEAKTELAAVQAAKSQAVTWPDNTKIPHIFYHSLIVDPARAFSAPDGAGYNQYMVTMSEFVAQLQQIYAAGWVLVHPQRIAAPGPDGTMVPTPIVLPPGKKPLVLSLDDLSYYEYMAGKGFPTNLVVKPDGRVVNTYTDAAGTTTEGSYDVVPIVDDFVREHPDFSYQGDKGTIALTGYNGILGYRTSVSSYGDTPQTHEAQAQAKVVADAIKANGWNFASHSWGHISMTTSALGYITSDAKLWDAEVRPLVGDTPLLIYAFGADIGDAAPYTAGNPKFTFLSGTEHFSYFFGVDGVSPYWVQIGPGYVRQARVNVDGLSMQRYLNGKSSALPAFFDVRSVLDPARPLPVPS